MAVLFSLYFRPFFLNMEKSLLKMAFFKTYDLTEKKYEERKKNWKNHMIS